jgi:hypothetical protein
MSGRRVVARVSAAVTACVIAAGLVTAGAPAAHAAGSNDLNVTASEYNYKVSGKPKAGLTRINFDNTGDDYHVLAVVLLKPGITKKQLREALESSDENALPKIQQQSGLIAPRPGLLGPGEQVSILADLPAGHFGAYDYLSNKQGQLNYAKGMVTTFDIAPGASTLTPPASGALEVNITDGRISLGSQGAKNGWAKITNSSSANRSLILARYLKDNANFRAADAYFNAYFGRGTDAEAPAIITGTADGLIPGSTTYVQFRFDEARYVFVSVNQDLDDDPAELHYDFKVKPSD